MPTQWTMNQCLATVNLIHDTNEFHIAKAPAWAAYTCPQSLGLGRNRSIFYKGDPKSKPLSRIIESY